VSGAAGELREADVLDYIAEDGKKSQTVRSNI
jgi:hypothetical protein